MKNGGKYGQRLSLFCEGNAERMIRFHYFDFFFVKSEKPMLIEILVFFTNFCEVTKCSFNNSP